MGAKRLLCSVANHLGFLDAYTLFRRKLTQAHIAILMYHRVSPERDNVLIKPLSLKGFEKQIQYLSKNYEILSLESLVQYLQQRKPLPQKAVVITLDDGYKDSYLYAYPILRKYHVPATVFLTTGCIDTGELFWWDKVNYVIHNTCLAELLLGELGRYSLKTTSERLQAASSIREKLREVPDNKKKLLVEKLLSQYTVSIPDNLGNEFILSWQEIREMKDGGITFGAHTVNHPILTKISLKQAMHEITQSKRDIEQKLRQQVTSFCYPNGSYGDFNSEIIELVKESGFTSAVTSIPGLITTESNPYELKRISVSEDFNMFKVILSNLYLDLRTVFS